ncbi:MAG: ZIP family metal transporter [Acidobacteria bacterium]|nr:ZIP family metal transporter [Acidobacteriota bacterium]
MPPLVVAVGLSLLGSAGGVLTASALLLFHDRVRVLLVPWLVSYAVGTLLGISLLALLPEALGHLEAPGVFATLLGGILTFFVFEKLVLWRHCHTDDCALHGSAAPLVLIGDAFHSLLDGALISAAVVTSIPLGVSAAIAVAAHEIPQEVGDFAILLAAGYTRRRALMLNLISGMAGVAGALFMYLAVNQAPTVLPYVLPFAAGGLLYVAMADLIPSLHRGQIDASAIRQILLIAAGIATIVAL